MKKQNLVEFRKDIRTIVEGLKIIHSVQPGLIMCSVLMAIAESVFPFINIYMSAQIVNEILGNKSLKTIVTYIVITLILNLIVGVSVHALNRTREVKSSSFYFKSCLMFSYINHNVDYEILERADSREDFQKVYDNLIQGGLVVLQRFMFDLLKNTFSVVIAILMSYKLFITHSQISFEGLLNIANSSFMTFILMIMTIGTTIITIKINLSYNQQLFKINRKRAKCNKYWEFYEREYIEDISSGKDIRLYSQNDLIIAEIKKALTNMFCAEESKCKLEFKCTSGMAIISELMNGMVYILVALKAVVGMVAAGNIIQYTGAINKFINGISGIATALVCLKENNKYMYALEDYVSFISKIDGDSLSSNIINQNDILIEFHNVSFKYPDSNEYVIKNFSFSIRNGERIAIVGMNGSGKSTMVKLICRLYEPQEGYITINNIDIRCFNREEYMKLIAVVFQDFQLLGVSIAQNIASSSIVDENKVWSVINKVGLEKNINKFEKGINTKVGKDFYEDGVEISGGEAQRIAIARALYKDAPIIILDEPTAALDPIVEADIYEKLNFLVGDKTAIYISHRLSSCKFCDKILVLHLGEIIQFGTHDDLVVTEGKYKEMWDSQSQYYYGE